MPYDVGVRSYLQGKGVASGDIGYDQNSGNVTIRNQPFYKPELNMAGTTYSSQPNLDSAYSNYSKTLPTIQPDGSTAYGSGSSTGGNSGTGATTGGSQGSGQGASAGSNGQSTQYTNPYTQQIADLMKHLSDTSNAPQQDIYSSPQYAAAQAAQARTSEQAIRQANEQAAGAGLGHSTIMTDRSQRIQDDSNNYLQTQLVPQIMSQLQAQRQQELTNQQSQLSDYMNLANHADSEHQNQITNTNADRAFLAGRQDAATAATGYYNPSGMTMDQINQEIAKNSGAYASATPEKQQELHARNIELNNLLGKTYDPNTGTYSGGTGQVGTRTLAGQTLDLNNAKDMAVLTGKMPDGTPTSAQQQLDLANEWKASETTGVITPKLAAMYNLAPNTPTEAAKQFAQTLNIQQGQLDNSRTATSNAFTLGNRNADIAQGNQDLARANAFGTVDPATGQQTIDYQNKVQDNLYKIWNETGKAPEGIPGVAKDTPLNSATVQQRDLANAYKTWNDTGVAPEGIPGVVPGTPKYNAAATNRANFNAKESAVVSQFDTVPKANLKAAIQDHKSQIIGQVGQTGYDKIYNSYFDPITGALR